MSEPGLTEIATTSLRRRVGKIQKNVINNNAVLYNMEKLGSIKKGETGRTLVEEHDFAENSSFIRYEADDVLNTTQGAVLTAFEYNWKQAAVAIVMNGLEEVQNGGIHQSIKLLSARQDVAEDTIKNIINGDILSDGTADGGKQIGGLDLLLAEDPTTGTVGGVPRASNTYARNFKYAAIAEGGAAGSVANIETYMRRVAIRTHRQGDMNQRMWGLGNAYWEYLNEATSSRTRFIDTDLAELGHQNIKLDGVTCVLFGGYAFAGSSAQSMESTKGYLMNLKYLKLRIGKNRFFEPLKDRDSINQDAMVRYLVFCGNMTCSAFGLQGVLFDS